MPVHHANPEADHVGRFNRLSASQANTYRACPRLWFYEKVYRFKMPQIPVLFVGRAVEEALCRAMKESPSLLVANSGFEVYADSPYTKDGSPNDEVVWPASMLMPFLPNERPMTKEALEAWAMRRCEIHLPQALQRAHDEWLSDERRSGDWSEVDPERCLAMVKSGMKFHLAQVERCYAEGGGPFFERWRRGDRPDWPAPDGFPFASFEGGHPLAEEGPVSWTEAWEVARPWFVDPSAPKFTMNTVHPDHWFQGEYDLVYQWTGDAVIVDIKASVGATDRSGDYVEQMRTYAMLWNVTHDRAEHVAGLEIWYLGHPSIKEVEVPNEAELIAIEKELEDMWNQIRREKPSLEDCPPAPAPMRGFAAGGKPTEAPDVKRCARCDWRTVCPGGEGDDEAVLEGSVQLPGATQQTPLERIDSLEPRATIRGEISKVGYVGNNQPLNMTVQQDAYSAKVQVAAVEHSDGEPTLAVPAVRGQEVLIKDAVFTVNWKGEIVLKIDPFARVMPDDDPSIESQNLFDIQAKHNIAGRVIYAYEKKGVGKTGKTWHRKGIMIMDHTGAIKVEGWADDWNAQFGWVEPGDVVVCANVGLDAWAVDVRADYTRNSRLQIIAQSDPSTA